MEIIKKIKENRSIQYLIGFGLIISISSICYFLVNILGYQVVALILLLVVSLLAMLFDIVPVLVTAGLSALIWNFFFIPPLYKFTIGAPEDILLFLMYFVIAMVNAVLTSQIHKSELKSKEKQEKEKTIKLYNTLLNSLSHELRTPISTIIGSIDTLKEGHVNLTEKNKSDLLIEIDKASIRLNGQVENLLNMSRLESGFIKPKLDWCDMEELLYKVIKNNKGCEHNHDLKLNIADPLPLFKLDRGLMEQVLQNILLNAFQNTPDYSIIVIDLSNMADSCHISISDNGPGFPEDKITDVFEKFYRLPNSVTGGTGLGLSIAKGLVEAHNGTLTLENLPGKGAKFIINIPSEILHLDNLANE